MMDDVFRGIRRVCYAGLDSVTLRKELAARIAPVVPFDAYAFSTTDPDTGLLNHTVAESVPEAMFMAYCTFYYPYEAARIIMDASWEDHAVFSLWEQLPDLQAEMRGMGLKYDVHVGISDRGGYWGDWCIMREQRADASDKQQNFLQRILPHVTHALKAGALIDAAYNAVPCDSSTVAPCVITLDQRSQPVLRAGPVGAILNDLADYGLAGLERMPSSILNAAARARHAHRTGPRDARFDAVVRARGRSGRWYTIRAMVAEPDATGTSVTVVVIRPMAVREKAVLLTRLYGLSEREREITAAVARGESTKHIAARLRISPHTVKEHLDRACAKIGVRGRKALVARLFLDTQATKHAPD